MEGGKNAGEKRGHGAASAEVCGVLVDKPGALQSVIIAGACGAANE